MADLTVRYKGQPIVEMTESGTKTLKTGGKYCEDDISVEYAKPAGGGGGGSGFAETICTDVIENHIVVSSWSPSVTAEEHIPKKYYYNGVLLPELPVDALAQYPYAWLRDNTTSGYYDLLMSSSPWWCSTNTSSKVTISTENYTQGIQWHRVQKSAASSAIGWTFNQVWNTSGGFGAESNRPVFWSNHDIPNGSATATEIYFEGSEPVLAE